ncbi:MAG TPA: cation transporter [Firmicutes bacterium]|nr:cation transporter [Bacillota bacterium]
MNYEQNKGAYGQGEGIDEYIRRAHEQDKGIKSSQKTLLASLLLSMWAPLATGIAMILGHSVTLIADFTRRTMEFLVLLLSWLVFRYLNKEEIPGEETKKKWERVVNLGVAVALGTTGLLMLILALSHFRSFNPGGNVIPGLIVALLGLIVNLWFWRRYHILASAGQGPIIDAQRQMYLAKVFVDTCVLLALGSVALVPNHAATRHIDTLGSVAVSIYLLWSSCRIWLAKNSEAELPVGE